MAMDSTIFISAAQRGRAGCFAFTRRTRRFDWLPNQTKPPVASLSDTGYGYNLGESLLLRESGNFSYGYNDWGAWDLQKDNPTTGSKQRGLGGDLWDPGSRELKATRVRKPAEMIAIADNKPDGHWDFAIDPKDWTESPQPIHNGGANFLWCDGHVTKMLQKEYVLHDLKNPTIKFPPNTAPWNKIAPMWNNDNRAALNP